MRSTAAPDLRHLDVHGTTKPLLRGRIHLAALLASVPAGVLVVLNASTGEGRGAAVVYALTLSALFAASSAYHRLGRTERSRQWLRRMDHSTIYLLIAGSYTPICLLVLDGWRGWSMLSAVWAMAAIGVVLKLTRFDRTAVAGSVLYIAMGWAAVLVLPAMATALRPVTLSLLIVGGLTYTVGAVVLGRRRPDPFPRVFGYHEVWHTLVVVAGICHYTAILDIVRTG